ncbi:hypothetical protein ICW40_01165 [Actinotalea ferrariae]|uniref:hypothetical protein n=1 Tax=Actinotalea ferrariae TaxID=1386098 RepID=UPI001C8B1A8E|nr:hypothetical protein [Actinotalea ferrariae]MBX9243415.1 hypothetical protein [Actinotalea ferrariae]
MNLRQGLVDLLKPLAPGVRVIGFPGTLDGVPRRTVALWVNEVGHLDAAPNGHYRVEYTLALYTPHQDPARADTDLDGFLELVLPLLWSSPSYVLDRAVRTVSANETVHSWTLTIHAGITISTEETP